MNLAQLITHPIIRRGENRASGCESFEKICRFRHKATSLLNGVFIICWLFHFFGGPGLGIC